MSQILKLRKLDSGTKANLTKLALVSFFLTVLDNIQSYYGQRVVNMFAEFNAIPAIFYSHGIEGYIMYVPIEFGAVFVTIAGLWLWASYLVWYCRNVVFRIRLPTWSRNP